MKTQFILFCLAIAVSAGNSRAATRTVTLDVRNLTCAVCPITVKRVLEHVAGVQHVTVDYAGKTATVEFDDAIATASLLIEATQNAGYPSSVKADIK